MKAFRLIVYGESRCAMQRKQFALFLNVIVRCFSFGDGVLVVISSVLPAVVHEGWQESVQVDNFAVGHRKRDCP